MIVEYAYRAGGYWSEVVADLLAIIGGGNFADMSSSANVPACVKVGAHPGGWVLDGSGGFLRPTAEGGWLAFFIDNVTVAAAEYLRLRPAEIVGAAGGAVPGSAGVVCGGQNTAGGGMVAAAGVIRLVVSADAVAISFPYAGVRQFALAAEATGDWFSAGGFPRALVMSSIAGDATFGVAKTPYFARIKNHAAAGERVGLSASALTIAAHPASSTGSVIGVNETVIWQGLPFELWTNPKAAHLGYARGVLLAPQKGIVNDEYLTVGAENWVVYRENATAAVAVAVKA